jgi:uncharacterized membrane protein YeaQ/YmgE (transglycosylase-associated protein family)
MGILGFIVLGLIVGAIVKAVLPDRVGGGWPNNLVLGVLGAILGGLLGSALLGVGLSTFFDMRTWLLAIVGGFIVTLVYGAVKGRRPKTRR